MSRDPINDIKVESCLAPIVKTSTTNCTGVDTAGATGLAFLVHYGATGDTLGSTVYVEGKVQKSTDNSSFTDCGATELISKDGSSSSNSFALINDNSEDDEIYMAGVNIDPSYRYYRVVLTFTGTHTYGIEVGVSAILNGCNVPVSTNLLTPA